MSQAAALICLVMLPATRGAEVLYHNVLRPLVSNVKARTQSQGPSSATNNNPFSKPEGFSMAGTTAPSSFEREYICIYVGPRI